MFFDHGLEEGATIAWAALPNANNGPYRRWEMAFTGLTDDTGIIPVAFFKQTIAAAAAEGIDMSEVTRRADPPDRPIGPIGPAKPFQLAINAAGGKVAYALDKDEEAGAEPFRQAYWNTAAQGAERWLFDSKGRVTPVAVGGIKSWYAQQTTAATGTPDHQMMASNHTSNATYLYGLAPDTTYDLVIYYDVQDGPDKQQMRGFGVGNGDDAQKVWLTEPKAEKDRQPYHDFAGEYVEATKDNGYTGN